MVIVGVKNLYDVSGKVLLLNCLLVITLVEGIELEAFDGLCIPDTQGIYDAVAVAHDGKVEGNRLNGLITFLEEMVSSLFIGIYIYIAAEFYNLCIFGTTKFKRIAVFQPVIGYFYLITVSDFLLEHTVTVTDTAAVCRITESCQRIKEAGCQTAQTAVTQRSIGLHVLNHVEVQSQLIQSFFYSLVCL